MKEIGSKAMDEVHAHLDIDFKSLDCVVAQINLEENHGVVSLEHRQQAQCRLLLHRSDIKELMVCPDPSFLEEILIVAPSEVFSSRIFASVLKESNLTLKDYGMQLTPDILQAALQFSLVVRLSPHWKTVVTIESTGCNLLVSDPDFVMDSSSSPLDAIKLRVYPKGCEMWIGISACRLRLPVMRPEYLGISSSYIQKILASSGRYIDDSKIGDPLVYVLPSLRKGKITSLTNILPLESEFENYSHIQRHWKETFGLILPGQESDGPFLLADVKFEDTNRSFVCPLQCLVRTNPVILKHEDPWFLVKSALKRIKSLVQILLLEINENHFLSGSEKSKKQPEAAGDVFEGGTESDASSNNTITNTVIQKPRKSTNENALSRYRLSLSRPSNETLKSHCQLTGRKSNSPNFPNQCSKSIVVSRLFSSTPRKRKLSVITTDHASPNQLKKENQRGPHGYRLKEGQTVESVFKEGNLDRVHRIDLVDWLRIKNISRGCNASKTTLLRKVREALMNASDKSQKKDQSYN